MIHSKCLEETALWKYYSQNNIDNLERCTWTKNVYNTACEQLKAVRDTFENYTLHDEIHVLNVLDAMGGLLGNRISELTIGEAELLILVSALHDLGMVYKEEDKKDYLNNNSWLHEYYISHPELRNTDSDDWDELEQQNYLRWLHPFRVADVIQQSDWRDLFSKCPKEVVPENVIIAVCRAHGEAPDKIRREVNEQLKYLSFKAVDPLFCAILLRLGDILDFDDSRAPSILFTYAGRSEKSIEEWKKHASSMGFNYPSEPSSDFLHYGALFTNSNIERAAHVFLDWIDEELSIGRNLLTLTSSRWNRFPIPFQVDRNEIERRGYDYGDFKITMDQRQIMDLLVGEELYSDRSVFVRELLQNSIDATLLRAEIDDSFAEKINTDDARIDLWEWWDDNGDLWFRIDDHGTGMTKGMLNKYFLKAGNSYYNSQEIKRDLNGKTFSSISRFGIGFLSCFLCGIDAYVSTTYFNSEKNIMEAEKYEGVHWDNKEYGLRLDVVGVTGYYTLRNQAIIDNRPEPFPAPLSSAPHPDSEFEKDGYRTSSGTSIAIRLNPGRLGAKSLIDEAKKWVCFPRMPIYYNGKRLCLTQNELISLAEDESGVIEYELTEDEKEEFDAFIPELAGHYPKIRSTIKISEANDILGQSRQRILLCETKVMVSENKRIHRNYSNYLFTGDSPLGMPSIIIYNAGEDLDDLMISFQNKDRRDLFKILSENELFFSGMHYGWKGIFAFHERNELHYNSATIIIIDENNAGPTLYANRDYLRSVPASTAINTIVWLEKNFDYGKYSGLFCNLSTVTLKKWKELLSNSFIDWMNPLSLNSFLLFKKAFEDSLSFKDNYPKEISDSVIGSTSFYWMSRAFTADIRYVYLAYLQINYRMIVNYKNKKIILNKINLNESNIFDLCPLMPFGYGETETDREIICAAKWKNRTIYTADHPFIEWLLNNYEDLNNYYPRQLEQIIIGLRHYDANRLINICNQILDQLSNTAYRFGIDVSTCPRLEMIDFLFDD